MTIGGASTPITYNAASQMTSTPRSNGAYSFSAYAGLSRSYTTNGLNQHLTAGPASFTYDTKGNLTSDGTNSYCYSSENLLTASGGTCSAPSVALSYDPFLRLYQVAGSTTTRLAYDGLNIIADYDGTDTLQHRYVFAPGIDQPIVEYSGSGTSNRTFLSADERGSILARTDSSGALVAPNTYDEYGIPGSTDAGLFQYTGQAWLNQLGMYYYRARIYSPTLGRFLQVDPIQYRDTANLYAYVGDDPIDGTDPLGLQLEYFAHFENPPADNRLESGGLFENFDIFGNGYDGGSTAHEGAAGNPRLSGEEKRRGACNAYAKDASKTPTADAIANGAAVVSALADATARIAVFVPGGQEVAVGAEFVNGAAQIVEGGANFYIARSTGNYSGLYAQGAGFVAGGLFGKALGKGSSLYARAGMGLRNATPAQAQSLAKAAGSVFGDGAEGVVCGK